MREKCKYSFAISLAIILLITGSKTDYRISLAQEKNPNKIRVAILRADGTLVPFAEYRHGIWWNPWPEPERYDESKEVRPKSLGNHPEPWFQQCGNALSTWYFWPTGDSPLALEASQTIKIDNHSQTNWALKTDYVNPEVREKGSHHNYDGFALDVKLKNEGIVVLDGGKEVDAILNYVKTAFSFAEAAEVERVLSNPQEKLYYAKRGFPPTERERARSELKVNKLFRSRTSINGEHIYYLEVEKQYHKAAGSADSSCHNVAFLNGWVLRGRDGVLSLLNDSFSITDCDGKERGASVELFSVLDLHGRTFIFTVEHGWEDESYTIYELKGGGLSRLLETFGG